MRRCLIPVRLFPIAFATSMPASATKDMRPAHILADRQVHRENQDVIRNPGRIELENETAAAAGWGGGHAPARFAPEHQHIGTALADTVRTMCRCNESAARAAALPFRCSASLPHDR